MVSHRGERGGDDDCGGGGGSGERSNIHKVQRGKVERLRHSPHESPLAVPQDLMLPIVLQDSTSVAHNTFTIASNASSTSSDSDTASTEDSTLSSEEVAAAERWKKHKETLAALDVSVNRVISSIIGDSPLAAIAQGSIIGESAAVGQAIPSQPSLRESVTDQAVAMAIRRHGLYTCGSSQSVNVGGIQQPPAHLLERAILSEAVSLAIQRKGLQGAPH